MNRNIKKNPLFKCYLSKAFNKDVIKEQLQLKEYYYKDLPEIIIIKNFHLKKKIQIAKSAQFKYK